MQIKYRSRFPIKQTDRNEFAVEIPEGEGERIINEKAAEILGLSSGEYQAATEAALRAIAIIK